ncbi:MAG: pyridoxal-phosphate dependent enzyme [Flavobacteriales bacterium]|nr:pyridoxal-phosphate dependent enzyme [Flavobacteriales bacterium]
MTFNLNTPIERVKLPLYNQYGIEVFIKRDDLIHPFISGNKWRKLKYNMLFMQQNGFRKLATFGGAFSNHLIATACAGAIFGYKTLGIVRGNELSQQSNHILRLCYEYGMELRFVSRSEYADKEAIANQLVEEGYFVVPEGGDNDLGIQGCEEILPETTMEFNHVFVPVGTATTLIGVVNSSSTHCIVHGIAALSEADYLAQKIKSKTNRNNWILHTRFSRGGFGKFDDELLRSNLAFTRQTGVLLDPVYTGKMIWASNHLIKEKSIKRGEKVLLIHTGGLTGLLSDKWLKMNL